MKIIIVGASSYVGARLYFDLNKKFDVIGTYNTNKLFPNLIKLDITKKDEVIRIIKKIRPDVIIHVAANPSSRWCEENPELAAKINEEGTRNVVDAANLIKAKVVYVSTFAAIAPINVYGKTKLAGEELVKNVRSGFFILRLSVVIGFSPNTTNDRLFNRILKNIDEKKPAIYDTSWKFQPTWLGHISEVIEILIKKNIKNEIIPISVPELKSKFDIAKDVLSYFNIQVKPKDEKDETPIIKENQEKLKELGVPQYKYSEIINKIITEIKDRKKFNIS
jgi:dTDP-4-dehydrorhamnose reductase